MGNSVPSCCTDTGSLQPRGHGVGAAIDACAEPRQQQIGTPLSTHVSIGSVHSVASQTFVALLRWVM